MQQLVKKVALLSLIASAAGGVAIAQSTSPACNDALITGVYGFTVEGNKLAGPGPTGPQVGVALTEFDGVGNLQQVDSVTIGGIQSASFSETPTKGTYQVYPNCTGTFTLNFTDGRPTVTTWFVIVDNGNEIDTVVQGVPKAVPPATQVPGVLATGSIGKRRFTPVWW
jgi:hypothetical protein